MAQVNLYLPLQMREKIKAIAQKRKGTMNDLIVSALEQFLEAEKKKEREKKA
jgi:hypothetical protein